MNNIFILVFTFLFLQTITAQDNKDFSFQYFIKYNFQDSIPDKKYTLKNSKISLRSSLKDFSGKTVNKKKSLKLKNFQLEEIVSFCMENFYSFNKAFVCKTEAAAVVNMEMSLKDKIIQIDFSPCNLNKDLITFKNFDFLLEKLLSQK